MFTGTSFIFDGIPSELYGLMIYNLGGKKQDDVSLGGSISLIEDRVNRRSVSLNYGTQVNDPMELSFVFGVVNDSRRLDRYDEAAVAGWLFGHDNYKTLKICQPDLDAYQYHCKVKKITPISVAGLAVAFEVEMVCDSPYAYHVPVVERIVCGGQVDYLYRNLSNVNALYFPSFEIECKDTSRSISIANAADPGRVFELKDLPINVPKIFIDGDAQIIQADGLNLYDGKCNLKFPRMVRGDNPLSIAGDCVVTIHSEFPMNIGA